MRYFRIKSWPLWWQLLIALGVSLLLVNWVATTTYKSIEESYMISEVEEYSLNTLSLLSSTVIDAAIVEDQPILSSIIEQAMIHAPNIFSICIKNEDGVILAEKRRDKTEDHQILKSLYREIQLEGEIFGAVSLEWDYAPLYKEIDNHIAKVKLYASAMLVLLAGLMVLVINYMAIGPVRKISRYLDTLAEGEIPEPLTIKTNHEIESLTTSANQLADFMRQKDEREIELLYTKDQLQVAHDAALSSSRAKSEFLATMSHEIRTPMNAILGVLDLVNDSELDESQKQLVKTGQDSGHLLLSIINDILDFSKMDAGKLKLENKEFNLHKTFSSTVELVRPLAEEKSLRIDLHIDPTLPKAVVGDSNRLQQILLNLANNAVKFTHNGGVDISVKHTSNIDGSHVLHCAVKDTGEGIPRDKQNSLFEEFTQVDQSYSRSHEGTGLGLAICKRLVNLMKGDIEFQSSQNHGSTFEFTVELGSVCAPSSIDSKLEFDHQTDLDLDARILLVEDNPANQLVISKILECAGLKSDIANNGLEALEAIQSAPYDIVLMDISMPVMDGIAATQAIRALPDLNRDLPIIALTAHTLNGDKQHYLDKGMSGHLAKPIDRSEMLQTIALWTSSNSCKGQLPVDCNKRSKKKGFDESDLDCIDCATIQQLAIDISPEAVPELVELYIKDARARIDQIEKACQERNLKILEFESHTLGSSAAAHGNQKLHQLARKIEHLCQRGQKHHALEEAAAIISIAERSFRQLHQYTMKKAWPLNVI